MYHYERVTETYNGKRYEGRGKTHREAERDLARKLEAAKRGEPGIVSDITVSEWADEWMETYIQPRVREPGAKKQPKTMSPNSYRRYEWVTRMYIKPSIGTKRMVDVKEADLRRILNAQKGMSYGHANAIRSVIKPLFNQAYVARIITFNPAASLELPAVEKGKRRSLTEEETAVFMAVAETHQHGPLFRFMLATGLRPNEVCALKVRHLDLKNGTVRVEQAVEAGTHIITTPKTEAGIRHTVINDESLVTWLAQYIKVKSEDDFVFSQVRHPGKMMTDQCIHNYWRSFAYAMDLAMGAETVHEHIPDPKDLKYNGAPLYPDPNDPTKPRNGHKLSPDVSLYCLRHSFGTNMQRKGVPVEVTKYLMGHEDISTTSNIYIDSGEPEALRAVAILREKS